MENRGWINHCYTLHAMTLSSGLFCSRRPSPCKSGTSNTRTGLISWSNSLTCAISKLIASINPQKNTRQSHSNTSTTSRKWEIFWYAALLASILVMETHSKYSAIYLERNRTKYWWIWQYGCVLLNNSMLTHPCRKTTYLIILHFGAGLSNSLTKWKILINSYRLNHFQLWNWKSNMRISTPMSMKRSSRTSLRVWRECMPVLHI